MPDPTPADLERIEAQLAAMGIGGRPLEEWRSSVTECEHPHLDASPV
jgi:hypothetical protein